MKHLLFAIILLAIGAVIGVLGMPYLDNFQQGSPKANTDHKEATPEIDYWVAPMDPNFRRDKPGKSPMGMDLVPVYKSDQAEDPNAVRISPSVMNNLGVRTEKVIRTNIAKPITTVGYVGYDDNKISHVHMRTDGWIEKLYVNSEGSQVKRGQTLFELYSPEIVNAQEEYLQVIKANFKGMKRSASTRLRTLGMSPRQIKLLKKRDKPFQWIKIYAPRSGIISKLAVREGMFVSPNLNLMTIADLSSIWLQVDVFERQANWVEKGQRATATFSYLPGTDWNGTVDYIYPEVDPKTRTFKVRLSFPNPGGKLKPNMYGKVTLYSQDKDNVLIIPKEAVIRSGVDEHVIIKNELGSFKQRSIRTGIENKTHIEVLSGLQELEVVVTSSQFLIDSEASLKASFNRLNESKIDEPVKAELLHYNGSGIVEGIKPTPHFITLTHDAIESLGWPEMTMDFAVDKSIPLTSLTIGERIDFVMDKHNENTFIITRINQVEAKQ